mgnify:CR=1 FL=1
MRKNLKIKFNKNSLYYFLGAVAASIFIFYWHITKPVTLDCRFGPYKDESGINRMDFIPYQELRINKRNRTMTFYHLKAIKGSTKYLGITTGPVKYLLSGSRYKTKFIKLEKLPSTNPDILKWRFDDELPHNILMNGGNQSFVTHNWLQIEQLPFLHSLGFLDADLDGDLDIVAIQEEDNNQFVLFKNQGIDEFGTPIFQESFRNLMTFPNGIHSGIAIWTFWLAGARIN